MKKFYKIISALLVITLITCLAPNSSVAATKYKYKIYVNRTQNVVTVYTQDENGLYTVPYKAFLCSVGLPGSETETIKGTFTTKQKIRWHSLLYNSYGQYITRIQGPYLFHSVPYTVKGDPSTLEAGEFDKLGEAASHGCIRLCVRDAKWIYDNCPIGTTVVIYDSEYVGALGKPEMIKIHDDVTGVTWDPTDIVKANPYNSYAPSITLSKGAVSAAPDDLEALLSGVTALSSMGDDITATSVAISGIPEDLSKSGFYRLTYTVTDLLGRSASADRYVRLIVNK